MKKLLLAIAVVALLLPGCKKINDELDALGARLDQLEKATIPTIEEQLSAINTSLADLEAMDSKLKGYIDGLTTTAESLQTKINSINTKIEEVKNDLRGEISEAKKELLDKLGEVKTELEEELSEINKAINLLKAKDKELDDRITELKSYIDTELSKTTEWIKSTLATLEQYNSIAGEVSAIKEQITSINNSITALESRINNKIATEIANAMVLVDADIQQKVSEITEAYTDAITEAKNEIRTDIQNEIVELENSLKNWVGEQLAGYYTIAEVDAKILILQNSIAQGDDKVREEMQQLAERLSSLKAEVTEAYQNAITTAIAENNGAIDSKIATALSNINARIDYEVETINTRISMLEERLDSAEQKITTIEQQVSYINATIEELQKLGAELQGTIEQLSNDEKANADEIKALQQRYTELTTMIAMLQDYVDTKLKDMTDWANATFATLDQYMVLSAQLSEIYTLIEGFDKKYTDKLNEAIAQSQSMMKMWISDVLSGYYTIAEMDGKLAALRSLIEEGNADLLNMIASLENDLKTAKSEITEAYKAAILEAINANNGVISQNIAAAIDEVNQRVNKELADIKANILALEDRLGRVEKDIATINEQISNINATIEELEAADKELKGYIDVLTSTAENLQEQLNTTNTKIDNLRNELQGEVSAAKNEVLAQLDAVKTDLENELAQITTAISALQAKDAELEKKITDLQTYVDTELSKSKDWAEATFATLEQFNSLADDIATIKAQITTINNSIAEFETRINEKIATDIANAVALLDANIQQKVKDITDGYTSAINSAKSEITTAYTAAISNAISALESSIKSWVNGQLANYYTIAEVEALLAAMESEFNSKLDAQKAYLEGLISSLSQEVNGAIQANAALIKSLQESVSSLQGASAEQATAIANNASAISKNAQDILDNTAKIGENTSKIEALEGQIAQLRADLESEVEKLENSITNAGNSSSNNAAAVAQQIESLRNEFNTKVTALETEMQSLVEENKSLISANSASIKENTTAIATNAAAIKALQDALKENGEKDAALNATVVKNATDIATNAENIAKNAALVAQNATAIGNNAQAIAQNTADILQLQQELAKAKSEITEAYKKAISEAITALDGELRGEIATQVANINTRIDNEIAAVNATIDALTTRVATLESEIDAIQQQIADILQEIAGIKQDIADLMKRIQSVTYIPKYSDGKATVTKNVDIKNGTADNGVAEFDFQISPKDAVKAIAANWQSVLSMKAVYTQTRAVSFVELPILTFEADETNGIISITVSGENLSKYFYYEEQPANASLYISDGNNSLNTQFIELIPNVPAYCEINNVGTIECYNGNEQMTAISSENGVIKYKKPINKISGAPSSSISHIVVPPTVTSISTFAMENSTSLKSVYISDLEAWFSITFSEYGAFVNGNNHRYCSNPLSQGAALYLNGVKLEEIIVPESITEIKLGALYRVNAKSITLHENIAKIGAYAMAYASVVYIKNPTPPTCGAYAFSYPDPNYYGEYKSNCTIYVPRDSVNAYKTAWKDYANKIYPYDFVEEPTPETWKIRYTATAKVEPNKTNVFGAKIVSNEWNATTGEGVITFDGEVTSIGSNAFDALEKTDIGRKLISISIPDTVTEIGYSSFCGCTSLESITIPDSVISIGQYAFCECSNLKDIVIPKSVKAIAAGAFIACNSLTSITIPDGISKIEVDTFTECAGLTEITIPDNITEIADCAFYDCPSLKSVTIGSGVVEIGWRTFGICAMLTNIYCRPITPPIMSEGYSPRDVFNGCSNLKKIYVPSTSFDAYKTAEYWKEYADKIVAYDFEKGEVVDTTPETWKIHYTATEKVEPHDNSVFGATLVSNEWDSATSNGVITFNSDVTLIGEYAFRNCSSLIGLVIPEGVTEIGGGAFIQCSSLKSITIPDNVTSIGNSSFMLCSSLTSFSGKFASSDNRCLINEGVLYAFAPCGLTEYTIPNTATSIGVDVFCQCKDLVNITIPEGVTSIGNSAFRLCEGLTSIIIPNGVTSIGNRAFKDCKNLKNVTIPSTIESIGQQAFTNCTGELTINCNVPSAITPLSTSSTPFGNSDFSHVIIGDEVTTIGLGAFYKNTSIESITLGNNITTIQTAAFRGCAFTSITLPESVTSIGFGVFYDCGNLVDVFCKATTPPVVNKGDGSTWEAFDNNAQGRKIYVPSQSVDAYKAADGWKDYADSIVAYDFEKGEVVVANNVITYTTTDGKIATPYSTSAFGSDIVSNTYENGAGTIKFKTDVININSQAFRDCDNLLTITLPETVSKIGQYMFYGCSNLNAIYCRATTPPSIYYQYDRIGSFPFREGLKIYVPSSAIDAYTQYATSSYAEQSYNQINWSQYQSYLEAYDF